MKQLLNDPVIAFGGQFPVIFIPATSSSILSLLDLLTTGQTIASDKKDQENVSGTAKVLGITLKTNLGKKIHENILKICVAQILLPHENQN